MAPHHSWSQYEMCGDLFCTLSINEDPHYHWYQLAVWTNLLHFAVWVNLQHGSMCYVVILLKLSCGTLPPLMLIHCILLHGVKLAAL